MTRKPGKIQQRFRPPILNKSLMHTIDGLWSIFVTKLSGYHIHIYYSRLEWSEMILGQFEKITFLGRTPYRWFTTSKGMKGKELSRQPMVSLQYGSVSSILIRCFPSTTEIRYQWKLPGGCIEEYHNPPHQKLIHHSQHHGWWRGFYKYIQELLPLLVVFVHSPTTSLHAYDNNDVFLHKWAPLNKQSMQLVYTGGCCSWLKKIINPWRNATARWWDRFHWIGKNPTNGDSEHSCSWRRSPSWIQKFRKRIHAVHSFLWLQPLLSHPLLLKHCCQHCQTASPTAMHPPVMLEQIPLIFCSW